MKSKISEYTEKEFLEFVKDIYTNNKKKFPTEESHIQAVLEFKTNGTPKRLRPSLLPQRK